MYDVSDLIRRAWPLFHEAIRMRRTITYTELAGRVGPPLQRRQVHRQLLVPLSLRCARAGLPDLCALIVRKDTGMPGGGWHGPNPGPSPESAWAEALEACFQYPWQSKVDPRLVRDPITS